MDTLASGQGLEETVDVAFHGARYLMLLRAAADDTLTVEIEECERLARWRGQFSAKYVEDITSKTGSFKKFGVFVRMLLSAARQQSDSVFMDLLTYQDLEALKSKKQQQQQGAQPPAAARPLPAAAAGKRYLILTYASEFDRVHYPLPLAQEGGPDPARLMALVSQLRAENARLQGRGGGKHGGGGGGAAAGRRAAGRDAGRARRGDGAAAAAAEEDDGGDDDEEGLLDARRGSGGHACGSGASAAVLSQRLEAALKERDLLLARLEAAEAEAEREAGLHRRELRRKGKEWQEVHDELMLARETIRELRAKCRHLEEEAESARRRASGAAAGSSQRSASVGRPYRWSSTSTLPGVSKYPPAAPRAPPAAGSRGATPPHGGAGGYAPHRASPAGGGGGYGGAYSSGGGGGGSRTQSPGYARPRASAPSSAAAAPRPGSAPPRQRFDPTEYVRQKRERELAAAAARGAVFGGGSGSAAGSAAGSRGATPPRSRAPSVGAPSPAGGRAGSRGRGGDPYGGGGTAAGYGAGGRAGSAGRQRPAAAAESPVAQRPGWGSASVRDATASPGRALQSVQRKLSEYVSRQTKQQPPSQPPSQQQQQPRPGSAGAAAARAGAPPALLRPAAVATAPAARPAPAYAASPDPLKRPSPRGLPGAGAAAAGAVSAAAALGGGVFDDATSEIEDIDKRLASLQSFLRTAKAGAAGA